MRAEVTLGPISRGYVTLSRYISKKFKVVKNDPKCQRKSFETWGIRFWAQKHVLRHFWRQKVTLKKIVKSHPMIKKVTTKFFDIFKNPKNGVFPTGEGIIYRENI